MFEEHDEGKRVVIMRCVIKRTVWCPMLEWDVTIDQCECCKYYKGIDEDGYVTCEGPTEINQMVG